MLPLTQLRLSIWMKYPRWRRCPALPRRSSGADPIETRQGFAEMLQTIAGNGVRTIIVETANRFARDLMVQEVGFAKLRELGIELRRPTAPTPSSMTGRRPS